MRSSLTTLVVLVTVIHVAAFVVWAAIRLWPDKARGAAGQGGAGQGAAVRSCAVCREPATHLAYDGLDLDERRDPHTGRAYSIKVAHYQPLCAAH